MLILSFEKGRVELSMVMFSKDYKYLMARELLLIYSIHPNVSFVFRIEYSLNNKPNHWLNAFHIHKSA
jgi:hypothetical protein